ncbi:hypothetical protein ABZY20_00585 [Streptomyces sp. NPDC006624]|uniref:hypothetical protein n=1 Tax=Streptomyces sp. NPDC006624 TaxID=3154892 RepID=UPI0033AE2247
MPGRARTVPGPALAGTAPFVGPALDEPFPRQARNPAVSRQEVELLRTTQELIVVSGRTG